MSIVKKALHAQFRKLFGPIVLSILNSYNTCSTELAQKPTVNKLKMSTLLAILNGTSKYS